MNLPPQGQTATSGQASSIAPGATGGPLNLSNGSTTLPAYSFSADARDGMWRDTSVGGIVINYIVPTIILGDGKVVMKSTDYFGWNADDNLLSSYNPDVLLTRNAAATLRLGNVNAASPVAYKLQTGGSRPGTDTNVGGANFTLQSGLGTGTGTASSLIFQTPTLAASGSGTQSYDTRLTIGTTNITATVPFVAPIATGYQFTGTAYGITESSDLIQFGTVGGTPSLRIYVGAASGGVYVGSVILLGADGNSGDCGLRRIGAGIVGVDAGGAAAGAALEMYEQTEPAAGAANSARIFAVDSGGGKTVLKVRFASGASQVIATEP